jgi:glucose/arabinose dehydrogenase
MRGIRLITSALAVVAALFVAGSLADESRTKENLKKPSETPGDLPRIPAPDPNACDLPAGFAAQIVFTGLFYPTSIEFDDQGIMYVAEAGESPGDESAPARILRIIPGRDGAKTVEIVADQLSPPVNDILWHRGRLYVSHRGKISMIENGRMHDVVTDLPSKGDHTNNQMAAGPDGKIYFAQGTATNSGVVGIDNYLLGWLHKHPTVHEIPAKDITLTADAREFESPDLIALFTKNDLKKTKTGAFHAFGKTAPDGARIKGQTKANGTILRMDPDGSNLEVYAWGLRNPFGLKWGPDGKLYASESAMDDRGSRPVANVPDFLWEIKQGAWYGFPDYAGGVPVTDAKYKPKDKPAPKFIMKDHPQVEKPLMASDPHASLVKFDFSPGGPFGENSMYLAYHGDLCPITGTTPEDFDSYMVARVDMKTWKAEPFFRARKDALGPKGFEHVATAGPRRPIAVRFSPRGDAMFVVDFGAIAMLPSGVGGIPKSFPGTGTIWVITPAAGR